VRKGHHCGARSYASTASSISSMDSIFSKPYSESRPLSGSTVDTAILKHAEPSPVMTPSTSTTPDSAALSSEENSRDRPQVLRPQKVPRARPHKKKNVFEPSLPTIISVNCLADATEFPEQPRAVKRSPLADPLTRRKTINDTSIPFKLALGNLDSPARHSRSASMPISTSPVPNVEVRFNIPRTSSVSTSVIQGPEAKVNIPRRGSITTVVVPESEVQVNIPRRGSGSTPGPCNSEAAFKIPRRAVVLSGISASEVNSNILRRVSFTTSVVPESKAHVNTHRRGTVNESAEWKSEPNVNIHRAGFVVSSAASKLERNDKMPRQRSATTLSTLALNVANFSRPRPTVPCEISRAPRVRIVSRGRIPVIPSIPTVRTSPQQMDLRSLTLSQTQQVCNPRNQINRVYIPAVRTNILPQNGVQSYLPARSVSNPGPNQAARRPSRGPLPAIPTSVAAEPSPSAPRPFSFIAGQEALIQPPQRKRYSRGRIPVIPTAIAESRKASFDSMIFSITASASSRNSSLRFMQEVVVGNKLSGPSPLRPRRASCPLGIIYEPSTPSPPAVNKFTTSKTAPNLSTPMAEPKEDSPSSVYSNCSNESAVPAPLVTPVRPLSIQTVTPETLTKASSLHILSHDHRVKMGLSNSPKPGYMAPSPCPLLKAVPTHHAKDVVHPIHRVRSSSVLSIPAENEALQSYIPVSATGQENRNWKRNQGQARNQAQTLTNPPINASPSNLPPLPALSPNIPRKPAPLLQRNVTDPSKMAKRSNFLPMTPIMHLRTTNSSNTSLPLPLTPPTPLTPTALQTHISSVSSRLHHHMTLLRREISLVQQNRTTPPAGSSGAVVLKIKDLRRYQVEKERREREQDFRYVGMLARSETAPALLPARSVHPSLHPSLRVRDDEGSRAAGPGPDKDRENDERSLCGEGKLEWGRIARQEEPCEEHGHEKSSCKFPPFPVDEIAARVRAHRIAQLKKRGEEWKEGRNGRRFSGEGEGRVRRMCDEAVQEMEDE
jgi:hypothetical protein